MPDESETIIIIPWDGALGVVYERDGKGRAHAGIRPEDWPRIERAAKAGKLILRGGQEVQALFSLAKEQRDRGDASTTTFRRPLTREAERRARSARVPALRAAREDFSGTD